MQRTDVPVDWGTMGAKALIAVRPHTTTRDAVMWTATILAAVLPKVAEDLLDYYEDDDPAALQIAHEIARFVTGAVER
jgi:hypothetical protein